MNKTKGRFYGLTPAMFWPSGLARLSFVVSVGV